MGMVEGSKEDDFCVTISHCSKNPLGEGEGNDDQGNSDRWVGWLS